MATVRQVITLLFFVSSLSTILSQTTNTNCAGSACHPNATCVPYKTTYQCQCNTGFAGNGLTFCYIDFDSLNGKPTCTFSEFQCLSGKCIALGKVRDGVADCQNKEDEECYVTADSYNMSTIRCDGKCMTLATISGSKCPTRILTGRMYCTFFNHTIGKDAFSCDSGTSCIPTEWVNDGLCSCDDCSDETPDTTTTSTVAAVAGATASASGSGSGGNSASGSGSGSGASTVGSSGKNSGSNLQIGWINVLAVGLVFVAICKNFE